MKHFHSLQVKDVSYNTDDCAVITFDVPEPLREVFRFTQGQSLALRKTINGEELRRNYSICSATFEKELRIAVKKVDGGRFSAWAHGSLRPGDTLDVMPPHGNFYTELHPDQHKNYVAFAAGSGITPLVSIIKTTLATEPGSSFTLVYGNRTKNSIIFRDELQDLKDRFMQRFRIIHILSREQSDIPINHGRIDTEKLSALTQSLIDLNKTDDFFICGPENMIFSVRNYLTAHKVPEQKIHFELFTVPGQATSENIQRNTEENAGKESLIQVKLDGILFSFGLNYGGETILDAALKQGADLPYACKGGVCTTCKARLLEGEVSMDVNWGLEPDEVKQGFVLTCQSHPRTPQVTVDFDVK